MTPPRPPTGDDTPQEISASEHDLLHTAPLSVSSCATNSKAFFIMSKAHSEAFIFFLKVSLYSSHVPFFKAVKPFYSISLVPNILWLVIPAATDLVFLPAPLPAETSSPSIFHQRKCSHVPRRYGSFSMIFHLHCTFDSGSSPFACRCLLKTLLTQVRRVRFTPPSPTPAANS